VKTKRKSSTLQIKGKIKSINNLTTNLILKEKLSKILKKIQEIIDWYPKIILKEEWDIGYTNLVKHEIYLKHDCLIKRLIRYVNPRLADWLKKELKRMETMGVIWKSCSPYALPITIMEVEKLDKTTKICLCSDVTDLNKILIKDAWPIPHQQIVFDWIGDAKWFLNFNLLVGYWQVKIQKWRYL